MRRREFITLFGATMVALPAGARAQQPDRLRRIGFLLGFEAGDPEGQALVTAFQQGLQDLGWTDGRNIQINYRWAGSDVDRTRAHAAELAGIRPDAIVTMNTPAVRALRQETSAVPIVFVAIGDPIRSGFVASLAHPGGNITGLSNYEYTMGGKWVAILKEIAPGIKGVALLFNPETHTKQYLNPIAATAPSLGVGSTESPVHNAAEIEAAVAALARESRAGLIVMPDIFTTVHRELIISLAARHRVPTIYPYKVFVTNGGLVSYAVDLRDTYRRAAWYVDRIFKGANPADLPVQQPTKFELAINLKTAKALGLEVPAKLLFTADEVIE